jgi:hypothetical protein
LRKPHRKGANLSGAESRTRDEARRIVDNVAKLLDL